MNHKTRSTEEFERELARQDAAWLKTIEDLIGVNGAGADTEVLVSQDFLDELSELASAPTRPEGTKGVRA